MHEQQLSRIEGRLEHLDDLLHLLIQLQGITSEQIAQLFAAKNDAAELERLITTLRQPTRDLAQAVKTNQ